MPETCKTCRWWDASILHMSGSDTTGLCRARAPKISAITGMAWWPSTEDADWCRRHEPLDADAPVFLGVAALDDPAPEPADRVVKTKAFTRVIPAAAAKAEDESMREKLDRMGMGRSQP